jgi:hypothetical protein
MITYEITGKTASNVDVVLYLPSDRLPNLLLLLERVDRLSTAVEDQQKRTLAAAGVLKNVGYYTALKKRNHKED